MPRLPLLLLACLTSTALACGFTVHMLNSFRALTTPLASTPEAPGFMALLRDNANAVYAGSPYPDYLYACGPNHDDGEYTHWSPFQAVAARYIRSHYPAPRNASGAQLVAFLAGITSHYMADISWHGLAETTSGYGFIESLGALDFNDTGALISSAHTEADTGAEFVAAYENGLAFDDPAEWVIPIPDLLAIYASANRSDVTAGAIEECAAIFFAGAEAVKALAALAEPALVLTSPTLGESFSDMLVGGSDDMAVMVGRMWARLASWLEDPRGPPVPVPGHEYCSQQNPCGPRHARARATLRARQDALRLLGRAVRSAGLLVEERSPSGGLVLRAAPGATPQALAALLTRELAARVSGVAGGKGGRGGQHSHGGQEQGRMRHAMPRNGSWTAEAPGDSSPYHFYRAVRELLGKPAARAVALAAGYDVGAARARWAGAAEGQGSAEGAEGALGAAFRAAHAPLPIAAPAPLSYPDFLAASTTPREYLGAAMAEGSFDGSGAATLVFTAYGASPEGVYADDALGVSDLGRSAVGAVLPQAGGFYTRGGSVSAQRGGRGAPPVEPILAQDRVTGTSVYSRLGSTACALDVNLDGVDDLVLGSPSAGWAWSHSAYNETPLFYYQGRVEVFLGVRGVGLPSPLATPSFIITPISNQSFLGQALHCSTDLSGDGHADLVIGSPFWQDPSAAPPAGVQKGRVDVFFASQAAFPAAGSPLAALSIAAANFSAYGGDQYEWLGHALAAVSPSNASALGVTRAEVFAAALGASGTGTLHPDCQALAAAAAADAAASGSAGAAGLLLAGAPGARRWDGGDLGWASVGGLRGYLIPTPGTPLGDLFACQVRSRSSSSSSLSSSALEPRDPPPAPPYPLLPPPLFSILAPRAGRLGPMISTKLGAAVSVGFPLGASQPPMLALAAPSLDLCNSSGLIPGTGPDILPTSAGTVLLFPLTGALRGTLEWSAVAQSLGAAPFFTRALLASALPDARFGWRLEFRGGLTRAGANASAQDLLVAAPQYSKYFLAAPGPALPPAPAPAPAPSPIPSPLGDSGRQAGALLVFAGGSAFPAGFVCAAENAAAWRTEGLVEHGRLGGGASPWGVVDWDGDGRADLVASAPRASLAIDAVSSPSEYGGALQVYVLPLA